MSNSMNRRDNGKKTIYSSRANVRNTPGIYTSGDGAKHRGKKRSVKKKRQAQMQMTAVIVALIAVLIVSILFITRKNAVDVSVGDYYIGQLKDTKITAEDLTNSVTAQILGETGSNVELIEEIKLEKVKAKKDKLVTKDYVLSEIKRLVTYKVEAAVITVNGSDFLAMATAAEAERLFEEIIAEYLPEDPGVIVEKGFVENVNTVSKFVDSAEIVSFEEAKEKLTYGTSSVEPYTIVSGDNLSRIAEKNSTTIEEILELNPGMTISTPLRIGEDINVKVMVPFLSVKTVETVVYIEKEAKQVETRTDSSQPASYRKVIQQGKDGQKEVTTQIIRINGFETEQLVVSEKTTVDPVTEIIVVGTN